MNKQDPPVANEAPMTVAEAGRLGGRRVVEKYGVEHYQRIGSLGGRATKAAYGQEFYRKIGRKGRRLAHQPPK